MIEVGGSNNNEIKSNDNTENKRSAPEKFNQELEKVAAKLNDMLFDDDNPNKSDANKDAKEEFGEKHNESEKGYDKGESDIAEITSDKTSELIPRSISESMDRLFSDDYGETSDGTKEENNTTNDEIRTEKSDSEEPNPDLKQKKGEGQESRDSKESDVEKNDTILERIEKTSSTPEGIKALIERHPEKAELWKNQLEALETLNDPDASPAEIRSAQKKPDKLKGEILEAAVKDALTDAGFDVEPKQHRKEGEYGRTLPDVVAKNNKNYSIEVFGMSIQPGETLSVECKCQNQTSLEQQLKDKKKIPNQLSGQEGTRVLLTTSDINNTSSGLAKEVCDRYGAKLVVLGVSVVDVDNAIKEVAES